PDDDGGGVLQSVADRGGGRDLHSSGGGFRHVSLGSLGGAAAHDPDVRRLFWRGAVCIRIAEEPPAGGAAVDRRREGDGSYTAGGGGAYLFDREQSGGDFYAGQDRARAGGE